MGHLAFSRGGGTLTREAGDRRGPSSASFSVCSPGVQPLRACPLTRKIGCPTSPPPTSGLPVSTPCGLERRCQALRDRSLQLCKPNLGVLSGSFTQIISVSFWKILLGSNLLASGRTCLAGGRPGDLGQSLGQPVGSGVGFLSGELGHVLGRRWPPVVKRQGGRLSETRALLGVAPLLCLCGSTPATARQGREPASLGH